MSREMRPTVVLFDLYKTLIDIRTDEYHPEVWERLARFLRYQHLMADAGELSRRFFAMAAQSQKDSQEAHPEVDVLGIFRLLLRDLSYSGPDEFVKEVVQLFRALTMVEFGLYSDTIVTLKALRKRFRLGLVSDAQRVFLEPELQMTGLDGLMDVIVVSSDHGFHKPDARLFGLALERLGAKSGEAVYVGDNFRRDICGAHNAKMRGVLVNRCGGPLEVPEGYQPFKMVSSLSEVGDWLLGKHSI